MGWTSRNKSHQISTNNQYLRTKEVKLINQQNHIWFVTTIIMSCKQNSKYYPLPVKGNSLGIWPMIILCRTFFSFSALRASVTCYSRQLNNSKWCKQFLNSIRSVPTVCLWMSSHCNLTQWCVSSFVCDLRRRVHSTQSGPSLTRLRVKS